MLSALVILALSATEPTTAVVLARRTAAPAGEAASLTEKVATRMNNALVVPAAETRKRLGALGLKDATTCNGGADCLVEIARQLKVEWLVLVSVSVIAKEESLALEIFSVAKAEVVDRESLLLPRRGDVQASQLESFSKKLSETQKPPEPPPVEVKPDPPPVEVKPDTPVVTNVVPPPVEPQIPVVPAQPPPPRSRAGSFLLGGVGIAAIGAGVGLLINGLLMRAPLQVGTMGPGGLLYSELRGTEAQRINEASTLQLGLAGGAGAVGLALLTTAIILW
ncbi:MAG: hypothetical protein JNM17_37170 [Archangium sp.]|nr:hypothetical protein [Archangium sp.]